MADVTTTLVDLIPVVVTGGILTKFTEYAFPSQRVVRRSTHRRSRKIVSSRLGSFSNVGY